jgi:hypothetical protein
LPEEFPAFGLPDLTEKLRQGDIITGLVQAVLRVDSIGTDSLEVELKKHPTVIVMTQDCDLGNGFRDIAACDRNLPNILFCECFPPPFVKQNMSYSSREWVKVCDNQYARFHLLPGVPLAADSESQGLEPICLDFRRFFTLPTAEVDRRLEGEAKRRTRLSTPFIEDLADRFHHYQARVALPEENKPTTTTSEATPATAAAPGGVPPFVK